MAHFVKIFTYSCSLKSKLHEKIFNRPKILIFRLDFKILVSYFLSKKFIHMNYFKKIMFLFSRYNGNCCARIALKSSLIYKRIRLYIENDFFSIIKILLGKYGVF